MLGKLSPEDQARLIGAMNTIETLLGGEAAAPSPERTYTLRAPRPGDFGWIVKRHAELYAQEYGWIEPFEGVCAQIVADFANKSIRPKNPARTLLDRRDGRRECRLRLSGRDSAAVARIRLLWSIPKARGLKLGTRLVDECIRFARRAGYEKITLWTHSVLTAARHIYQKAGFKLTSSEERVSFESGSVVSEYWDLEL